MTRSEKVKIILSCLTGNILEWFDFAVFGFIAPLIANQFVPSSSSFISILLTYSIFAIGFFIRPFGAILFGHIGDTYGRKTALVLSSFVMGIPTFCIGLLPNYETIGILAPILLVICRIFQGLSIGGEFTGAFIYLVEQGPPGRKGFFSCWADLGCSLGTILGSMTVACLSSMLTPNEFAEYGWRIPFLCGILISILGIYIRSHLTESIEFTQNTQHPKFPIIQLVTRYQKTLFYAILLIALNALGYYILTVFIPNQTILLKKLLPSQSYLINSLVLSIILLTTFLTASASDYIDKAKIYTFGCLGCLVLSFPMFYALHYLSLQIQIVLMCLFAICLGSCFGPRPLFLVQTFPSTLRFTAIALTFSISNAIFGGTAPLVATYLVATTGSMEAPSLLIIISSLFTWIAIINLNKINNKQVLIEEKDEIQTVLEN